MGLGTPPATVKLHQQNRRGIPKIAGFAMDAGSAITAPSLVTAILANPAAYFVIVHHNEFLTSALSGRLAQ